MGFRGHFRHEDLAHSYWRKWFSVRKFLRRHFEVTGIYHLKRTVLAPAIVGLSLSYSASCSLSFTNANDNLQRAEWLYHAGANPHFERKVIFISKRESSVISKRECCGDIRLWTKVSTWLSLTLFGLKTLDTPCVSSCIQESKFTMVNRISATLRRVLVRWPIRP